MKNTVLLILTLVIVSLYALGQENTKKNGVLFEDNDVDFLDKCTEDYPYIPLSEFKGNVDACLKANFRPGGDRVFFGLTNRTVKAIVDTMRKDIPVKTLHLTTNKYGVITWVHLYFDTPERIHQQINKGNDVQRVELSIPYKTFKKRTETIKKYIATDKLLEWDDKYLKILGGITYEYAIYDSSNDIFWYLEDHNN